MNSVAWASSLPAEAKSLEIVLSETVVESGSIYSLK